MAITLIGVVSQRQSRSHQKLYLANWSILFMELRAMKGIRQRSHESSTENGWSLFGGMCFELVENMGADKLSCLIVEIIPGA
jgi:hypothetical protein